MPLLPHLLTAALVALFAFLAPSDAARASPPVAPAGGWTWPLAGSPQVVRGFDAPAAPWAPGHRGVDLLSTPGARVLAAGTGVVTFAGRVAGRGVVTVAHGPLRTTYEPVRATVTRGTRGTRVEAGAVVGQLEAHPSHCAPRSCLHWGVRQGDTYLDPLSLLGHGPVRLLPIWDTSWPHETGARSSALPGDAALASPPPDAAPAVATDAAAPAAADHPPADAPPAAARSPGLSGAAATATLAVATTVAITAMAARRRHRPEPPGRRAGRPDALAAGRPGAP